MASLLSWAADVVKSGWKSDEENDPDSIPLIFTPEQLAYIQQLDRRSASLNRSIQDLRLRLPPPDISQRLPDLHAHSLASNNALVLQLDAHSATREQAQLREARLQEENAEYQNAISLCESKIQEKLQEANMLQKKLQEMHLSEEHLKAELQRVQDSIQMSQLRESDEMIDEPKSMASEAQKSELLEKLKSGKKELAVWEENVQELEKKWRKLQEDALKKPTPAQREKALDKQLHSLIEQLSAKQAQAEGLVSEIHIKEMELENLNGLLRKTESSVIDLNNSARNRFVKSGSDKGLLSPDPYDKLPLHSGAGRNESLQRLMLLRSGFVLYILVLHVLVFIKLSF